MPRNPFLPNIKGEHNFPRGFNNNPKFGFYFKIRKLLELIRTPWMLCFKNVFCNFYLYVANVFKHEMHRFTFSSANTDVRTSSSMVKVPAKEARKAPTIKIMSNITTGKYFRRKEKSSTVADKFYQHRAHSRIIVEAHMKNPCSNFYFFKNISKIKIMTKFKLLL